MSWFCLGGGIGFGWVVGFETERVMLLEDGKRAMRGWELVGLVIFGFLLLRC